MHIELTKDIHSIRNVLKELWDETTSDQEQKFKDKIDILVKESLPLDYFFRIFKDSQVAGIIHFTPVDEYVYEAHMNMLPKYRGVFAKEAGLKCVDILKNIVEVHALEAIVPDCYLNVQKFTEEFGLKPIKKIPSSWLKDSKWYDSTLYRMELN